MTLDQKGLGACWREGLGARATLLKKKGYYRHPQLLRFKEHPDPVAVLDTYLHAIVDEADARGYHYNRSKLGPCGDHRLIATSGQLGFELEHLKAKVEARSPKWAPRVLLEAHPMFDIRPGSVEPWEKISPP